MKPIFEWNDRKYFNEEEIIRAGISTIYCYCRMVKGRWKEVESILIQDALFGYKYATCVLKGRFDSIIEELYLNKHGYTSNSAALYVKELCNGMLFKWNGKEYFNEEDIIKAGIKVIFFYCYYYKKRWEEIEDLIVEHSFFGYGYAVDILKNRFEPELERKFLEKHKDTCHAIWYKKRFTK